MRHVFALFDAPVPARAAVRRLVAAGFDRQDITLIPDVPGAPTAGIGDLDPGDPERLAGALAARGLASGEAALVIKGLARGAILLVVAVPTLAAPVAARAIAAVLPPAPADLAADWAAHPDRRYRWAGAAEPVIMPSA